MKTAPRSRNTARRHNPASVYLSTLAPSGRRSMRCQLQSLIPLLGGEGVVEDYDWQYLQYVDVVAVRAALLERGGALNSINLSLSAVRGVMQTAFHLGQIDADTLLHIKSVKRIATRSLPKGRSLSDKALKRLIKNCQTDRSMKGLRDSALIATLATTGLRRAEVVALTVDQYARRTGKLTVDQTKHNRERLCPLPGPVRKLMRAWLDQRGNATGALFCPIGKDHQIHNRHLSPQALYDIIGKRAAEIGLGRLTPHDLRRTFITRLLESKVDINTVRELVGHSDIKTTSRYDHRTPKGRDYIERIVTLS